MGLWDTLKSAAVTAVTQSAANAVSSSVQASAQSTTAQVAPQQQSAPDPMTGPEYQPIAGVSLESYANMLALMSDVGEDEAKCLAIAAESGVSREAWEAAKTGWTARMADPALENRVSNAFLTFYGPALSRKRGGREPIELERYSRIFAETSFRKDPRDPSRQIEREVVLAEHGLTLSQWNEALVYWSPRVSDANDPAAREFGRIVQAESIRIMNGH